ncbi:alpha/beta hydrolase family protein [Archangium lansingense]|uniref:Uncharacterized protein n=1 Tax=Archangium lansingense TaxID=2995310 RepID=A0ABT4A7P3_9BACT|nr:hypothetical protein [Archangium lansinium]MCY1077635.1 hypothetical protein [Archangium lansinium]
MSGAAVGAVIAVVGVFVTVAGLVVSGLGWPIDTLATAMFGLLLTGMLGLLVAGLGAMLRRLPLWMVGVLAGSVLALGALFALINLPLGMMGLLLIGLPAVFLQGALGAGLGMLRDGAKGRSQLIAVSLVILAACGDVAGIGWLVSPGTRPAGVTRPATASQQSHSLTDPSQAGPYAVRTLFYGSGTDQRRLEYGSGAELRTTPVDGSLILSRWGEGLGGGVRTWYWGFDATRLPLNGRVWYPEGEGPFPLVVLVHGNYLMQKDSDSGYGYLGELLASRGAIVVSIDENFLNNSFAGGLFEDTDARAWLLLQHLKLWRTWNGTQDHRFFGAVDMTRIALVGHSRGGDAVALAHSFNQMERYPGNGALLFDFGFQIQAVASLSPTDGGARPAGHPLSPSGVNYLLLWGSHDADMPVYWGSRLYQRVLPGENRFKASVYIHRANHGQFNTVWGDKDLVLPMGWLLNRAALLSGAEQQQVARVYLSAFVEATLHGRNEYRELFRNPAVGATWLPETAYLPLYEDGAYQRLAGFEEDADVSTATLPGGRVSAENLVLWREEEFRLRMGVGQGNHAVRLKWEASERGVGTYVVRLPEGPTGGRAVDGATRLVLAIAEPDAAFRIEVADASGRQGFAFCGKGPRTDVSLYKVPALEQLFLGLPAGRIFRRCAVPLSDFLAAEPTLDLQSLRSITLRFDQTPKGEMLLDDVGLEFPERDS